VRVLGDAQACGGGSRTRLDVSEGIVEVRASGTSINVTAGQHWPGDCAEAVVAHAPPAPVEAPRAAPGPEASAKRVTAPATRPLAVASAAPTVAPPSELTQQNDLFAEGVALHRQGDDAGALRAYQSLIARFPGSPLAENALVERMRLLASRHDGRARGEAERYLSRYPHGFAQKEAHRLVDSP
jgi:hypothetical protein